MSFEKPQENKVENLEEKVKEKEPGFDLQFYVTDHSADHANTGKPGEIA